MTLHLHCSWALLALENLCIYAEYICRKVRNFTGPDAEHDGMYKNQIFHALPIRKTNVGMVHQALGMRLYQPAPSMSG